MNNKTVGVSGGPAAKAVSNSAAVGGSRPSERVAAAQKWFLQREAVLDACALATTATTTVQTRRRGVRDCSTQIVKLLDELRQSFVADQTVNTGNDAGRGDSGKDTTTTTTTTTTPDKSKNDEQMAWVNAMAEANSALFRTECGLEVEPNELLLPSNDNDNTETVHRRLQPLQRLLTATKDLRQLPQYNILVSAAGKGSTEASHIPALVKGLQDTLEECLRLLEQDYATCARSGDVIAAWAEWAQPLVRLVSECLRMTPLDRVVEEPRERLRRVTFDVKEKQREQEDAVTDGDMVRSEQLYFEKTALLETMRPLYDQLEHAIESHKRECGDEPLHRLRALAQELTTRHAPPLIARQQQLKKRGYSDLDKLAARREEVRTTRNTQRAAFNVYLTEWDKLFAVNQQQQEGCLRAMEELEQRLRHLCEERACLVEDRLEMMTQERQRADDAAAFIAFASTQENALRSTMLNVEQTIFCAQSMQDTLRAGYQQLQSHLMEAVQQADEAQLLEVRKERLEHFRGLYLTLGELQFKKERHVEELDKRIEYYHVQQELAMDTFNPRAKEFSKAKKDLIEVRETVQEQVRGIAQRAAQQLEEFAPTEKLLLASGVQFRHPVEELAEMNAVRTQKLLEYHSLMSTMQDGNREEEEDGDGNGINTAAGGGVRDGGQ
ncbi:Paraflagellar rod [Trypanosoma melophagium]|uniref:Paraflagellar rod n=1 Tax=Trypanosoma melophagium TaxID=715481 RepID=UPI00351A1FCC|nr:Paraflagellar rod [Trypanosoma melophagium]